MTACVAAADQRALLAISSLVFARASLIMIAASQGIAFRSRRVPMIVLLVASAVLLGVGIAQR